MATHGKANGTAHGTTNGTKPRGNYVDTQREACATKPSERHALRYPASSRGMRYDTQREACATIPSERHAAPALAQLGKPSLFRVCGREESGRRVWCLDTRERGFRPSGHLKWSKKSRPMSPLPPPRGRGRGLVDEHPRLPQHPQRPARPRPPPRVAHQLQAAEPRDLRGQTKPRDLPPAADGHG